MQSNGEVTVIKKLSGFNPKIVIDGGANTGDYSLTVNQFCPACTIYAFEPVDSTFAELENNVKNYKNIIPVKKGLFKENCTKEINIFDSNEHSSLYNIKGVSYQSKNSKFIELVSGDSFAKERNIHDIDLLKLDLEGAEYDALLGFENLLKEKRIKAIQFEYGYINITTKKLLADFYDLFDSYGYVVGKIYPKTVEFREYEFKHEDFIGPNFIAVNKKEEEIINALRKS